MSAYSQKRTFEHLNDDLAPMPPSENAAKQQQDGADGHKNRPWVGKVAPKEQRQADQQYPRAKSLQQPPQFSRRLNVLNLAPHWSFPLRTG